jgi:hypothetical protein
VCEWVEEVVDEGEGEEVRLCLWMEGRSVSWGFVGGFKRPFVEAREAMELDIVAGPDIVGWRGAVSSTFWRSGWRS